MAAQQASGSKRFLRELTDELLSQEAVLRQGGGELGRQRQKRLGRLTVRERLARLLNDETAFLDG